MPHAEEHKPILVTGGSGFVGSHIIAQLLAHGYTVRTTVRSLTREPDVRAMLKRAGVESDHRLSFIAADLMSDAGWSDAVGGCEYVLHVASPFPLGTPAHEDDVIIPARDGALRVLRAARAARVKRVVMTSSFAAIGYGHPPQSLPFDETSWSNLDSPGISAYVKSKTIAERAAWDFIRTEGDELELSVINPVGILGPVLGADYATSIALVKRLLDGVPGCARIYFGVVDVRDVAGLHIQAMTHPAANGERFLAIADHAVSMLDIAQILKRRMRTAAKKVPTIQFPNWLVRIMARFSPELSAIVPQLGKYRDSTSQKARRILGWTPRSTEDAVVATGESLVELGLV